MKNKYIQISVIGLMVIVSYWLLILSVNIFQEGIVNLRTYFRIVYRFAMLFIAVLLYIPYIIIYCAGKGYKKDDALKYILYACCIQFFIVILFVLIPGLRSKAIVLMYNNTGIHQYLYDYELARRWYGFAISLQDGFSCGIGLAAGIAIYFSVKYGAKYVIAYLMLVIVAAFNARTGLLMAVLSIPFMITKKGKYVLQTISIFMLGGIISLMLMKNYFTMTYEWIVSGFQQLGAFLLREENVKGSIGTLFSEDFWMLPKTIFGIVFGTGHSTVDVGTVHHSDVGYVNYLWILGIVGSVILYLLIYALYFYSKNMKSDKVYSRLKLYFLFIMLIGNVKFDVFTYGPSIMLFFLVYYLEILNRKYIYELQSKKSFVT